MERQNTTPTTDSLDGLKNRLDVNRRYYREQDAANVTLAYFADAAAEALAEPYFRQQVLDMLNSRPDMSPAIVVKTLERAYQADVLRHEPDSGYPEGFTKERWLELFETVEADMIRGGLVWLTLQHRNLQSNVAERYKSIKLIAGLIEERFDTPPSHLDVGASVMHGSLKLAYSSDRLMRRGLEFGPIEIMRSMETRGRRDAKISKLANRVLGHTVAFGEMIGLDITDIDDGYTAAWAKSCSFYPDELRDQGRMAEYEALETIDPAHERVKKFVGDFSNSRDFRRLRDISPSDGFDIITFSTVFYQVSKEERVAMLVNAAQLLSDRGIIIIQDGIDGDFSRPYNYVTSIRDSQSKDQTMDQELLRWRTPRCRQAVLGSGVLRIRDQAMTMRQALEASGNPSTTAKPA
jgi:hypothetical protein